MKPQYKIARRLAKLWTGRRGPGYIDHFDVYRVAGWAFDPADSSTPALLSLMIDGTPAMEAGIEAGDFITHVDGESVLGLTLDQAVDLMRGPVGSEIVITVVREGEDEPFDVSIIRDTIKLTAVRARTESDTVVLRVTTFNDQTYPNLAEGLAEQVETLGGMDNVNGVVLDLRNNPGGLLTQAIRVSDAFLEKGEIVSTRGRDPADGDRYNATPGDLAEGKPLVVLVNGGSASASEIVAGALQDHKRAVLMGTDSFGKGSVQTVLPLNNDRALKLTTALYYTPSGRSIQAQGIVPDIEVARARLTREQDQGDFKEADLQGHLSNGNGGADRPSKGKTARAARPQDDDYQLAQALNLLKGLDITRGN